MTPLELLQTLIRYDTTNPPGNELECIQFIDQHLRSFGFETTLVAKDPNRPNLIARLPGRGEAPPFLMQGHVDVVTTEGQQWTHPPFEAKIVDNTLYGRGTLDMKGGVSMMISSLIQAKEQGITPAGDFVLCILSDEENGGDLGAKFLVEEHPELFEGIRYGLGEFGGFNAEIGGKKFYPIQIAEKRAVHLIATIRGGGGHASGIFRGGTMAKTAEFLTTLDQARLPIHVTPAVELMLTAIADQLSGLSSILFRQLLNPSLANGVLRIMGARAGGIEPLLRNTINATLIQGGIKRNVIPSEINIEFDVRLLPGFPTDQFLKELIDIVGPTAEFEVVDEDGMMPDPQMGIFPILADILSDADPAGTPIPLVLPAVTDARYFAQLGIQTYGFTPIQFPPEFSAQSLVHAADERIPVAAVDFGTAAMLELIKRYKV